VWVHTKDESGSMRWKKVSYTANDTKLTCYASNHQELPEFSIDLTQLTSISDVSESDFNDPLFHKFGWDIIPLGLKLASASSEERAKWISYLQDHILCRSKNNKTIARSNKPSELSKIFSDGESPNKLSQHIAKSNNRITAYLSSSESANSKRKRRTKKSLSRDEFSSEIIKLKTVPEVPAPVQPPTLIKSRSQEQLLFDPVNLEQNTTSPTSDEKIVLKTHEEKEKKSGQISRTGRLYKIFQRADKDKNGVLDASELEQLIVRAFKHKDIDFNGKEAIKKYTQLQLKEYDKDGSGDINFEEFADLYAKLLNNPDIPSERYSSSKTC